MGSANLLPYVDYDFDSIVAELEKRLSNTDAWKDTLESSTGQMIIEFYAYVQNVILYYLERRVEEAYWKTARNKSSLVNLAHLISYTPKRRISASGKIQFSIASLSSARIYIPQYTECQTANGVKFVTIVDTTIEPFKLVSDEVSMVQGEQIEILPVDGDGTADQEVHINSIEVENDTYLQFGNWTSIVVMVDGNPWEKVSSFLFSTEDSRHYKVRAELDDTITIVFGNGVRGKAPPEGSGNIQISYIKSAGLSGNVYEEDKITVVNTTVYDENEDEVDITINSSSVMSGGADVEALEEIRDEAPNVFATGDRLVTKSDFKAILVNYADIIDANVWGEAEESPPNYDMFNRVKLCILLENWQLPAESFKEDLTTYLYDKSLMTVKYDFIEAEILYVIVFVEIIVNEEFGLSQTQSEVETTLEGEFELGSTAKLGEPKYLSNLIEAVDSPESVVYHHMELKIRKLLSSDYNSDYDYGAILGATPVLEGSIEIYVGDTQVGEDSEGASEDLTAIASGYSIDGTIDYDTGEIVVNIDPTPTEVVSVRYKQDSDGDIVIDNNQICKLYDVSFDSIGY